MSVRRKGIRILLVFALSCAAAAASEEEFKEIESRITDFTLKNGWKFIVLERHNAPVASFYTYADVGSAQEVTGITGLAHMFEHMAFKGSQNIGTTNYGQEKIALDRVDRAFAAFYREQRKGAEADKAKLAGLEKEFKAAQEAAEKFVVKNEFGEAIERAGGRDLNASTAADKTDYFFSLPSNELELWFYLEGERFRDPVFREFYKERDVVMEERRMRTENQPVGKLLEEFLAIAYKAHPYHEPTVGHMSDLRALTRDDAKAFFKKYYQPADLTSAIVGDVDPKRVRQLAELYLGTIPSGPKAEPLRTVEPPQDGERRVTLELPSQRFLLVGYHKPDVRDPDDSVYDAISSLLSEGRSSRLYRSLVRDKKIAVQAFGFPGLPGQKYPGLFVFFAVTAQGHTNQECEKAIEEETERLKTELVGKEELDGVKRRARSQMIRQLDDNMPMAIQLAAYQVLLGDWHKLFQQLDKINAVTPADIQRVAKKIFVNSNRTIGTIEPLQRAANR